ncbi:hypothetical protein AB834_04890 [PVC group bacterium (ex Bugula neritina AB1)]|nr:hypothetical protein AB834_04890 [PVC group bacterium (ex Bugula neritina AB1)]
MEAILKYFISRPILAHVLSFLCLACGFLSLDKIQKTANPDLDFDILQVSTYFPGASPEDVELFVTSPLEKEIKKVSGIESFTSESSESFSEITIEINPNELDKDQIKNEIRESIDSVSDLPNAVEDRPRIRDIKTSEFSMLFVALIHKNRHLHDRLSRLETQALFRELESQILNISEVSKATMLGYIEEEMRIELDLKKLNALDLSVTDVIEKLSSHNVRLAAGAMKNTKNMKEYVVIQGELLSVESLKNLRIRSTFDSSGYILLRDVAHIQKGFQEVDTKLKVNGYEGLALKISKNASSDALKMITNVKNTVKNFEKNFIGEKPYEIILYRDKSIKTLNKMNIILFNYVFGVLFIVIVIFIFLDFQTAIWTGLGLPIAISIALFVSYGLGYSLNKMTLTGILIAMGLLVDDAIVISENIHRSKKQGLSLAKASFIGTLTVLKPVISSTLTTIIVFLPLFIWPGIIGKFMGHIASMVVFVLIASLFEATLMLPSHLAHPLPFFLIKKKDKTWFKTIESLYRYFLLYILKFKKVVVLLFFVIFFITLFIAKKHISFVLFPRKDASEIMFYGKASFEITQEKMAALSQKIESLISPYLDKGVNSYVTTIAQNRWGKIGDSRDLFISIELLSRKERSLSADDYISFWQPEVEKISELKVSRFYKSGWGYDGEPSLQLYLSSNNDKERLGALNALKEDLKERVDVGRVESDESPKVTSWKVAIRHDEAVRLKVSPEDIALVIRSMFEGVIATRVMNVNDELKYRVTLSGEKNIEKDQIKDMRVRNRDGQLVSMQHLVTIEKTSVLEKIDRLNGRRTVQLEATIADSKKTELTLFRELERSILPKIKQNYPSVLIEEGDDLKTAIEMKKGIYQAVLIAVMLIYMVLVLFFNSFWKPWIIFLSVPFGVLGIIWMLPLHGSTQIGMFTSIAAIALLGVLVNDSIVLIDKLDQFFMQHLSISVDDIVSICVSRLKAIVLTSLTTCVGLLPTAYGWGGYDPILSEITLAMFWGMVVGTSVTLVLIPCIYSWIYERYTKKAPDKKILKNI